MRFFNQWLKPVKNMADDDDLKNRMYAHATTHSDSKDILLEGANMINELQVELKRMHKVQERDAEIIRRYMGVVDL